MAVRYILHKTHLTPFKTWLATNGYLYRAPRGQWQVLQIQDAKGAWQCIYEKLRAPEHYSAPDPLYKLVRAFLNDYKGKKHGNDTAGAPVHDDPQGEGPPWDVDEPGSNATTDPGNPTQVH